MKKTLHLAKLSKDKKYFVEHIAEHTTALSVLMKAQFQKSIVK